MSFNIFITRVQEVEKKEQEIGDPFEEKIIQKIKIVQETLGTTSRGPTFAP